MNQIAQGLLYPSITPTTILLRDPDDNSRDLSIRHAQVNEVTRIHTRKDLGEPARLFARYYRPLCAGAVEPRMLTQGTTPAPSLTQ